MARRRKRKLRTDRLILLVAGCICVIICCVLGGKAVLSAMNQKKDERTQPPTSVVEQPQQEEGKNVISLVGVGDNLIHETVYLDAENDDGSFNFEKMYANVKEDIQAADIAFINQETVLGGNELGLAGYPCFNSPTEIAQNLKDTGFTLANIASNHTIDTRMALMRQERHLMMSVSLWMVLIPVRNSLIRYLYLKQRE